MKVIYTNGTVGELPDLPWLSIIEPVAGPITQAFAVTSVTGIKHRGEDRAPGAGIPIHAVLGGRVSFVRTGSWNHYGPIPADYKGVDTSYGGYGNQVTLDHDRTVQSHYGHFDSIVVAEGQYIKQGDLLGYVGSTGISTGPHLHYELRFTDGTRFDPQPYYSKPPEDEMTDDERAALAWLVANKGALSPYVLAANKAGFTAANDTPAADDGVSKGIRRLAQFQSDVLMSDLVEPPTNTSERLARELSR